MYAGERAQTTAKLTSSYVKAIVHICAYMAVRMKGRISSVNFLLSNEVVKTIVNEPIYPGVNVWKKIIAICMSVYIYL